MQANLSFHHVLCRHNVVAFAIDVVEGLNGAWEAPSQIRSKSLSRGKGSIPQAFILVDEFQAAC